MAYDDRHILTKPHKDSEKEVLFDRSKTSWLGRVCSTLISRSAERKKGTPISNIRQMVLKIIVNSIFGMTYGELYSPDLGGIRSIRRVRLSLHNQLFSYFLELE